MTTLSPLTAPVKFGKAADAQDVQLVAARQGEQTTNADLVFSYADPQSRGFLGLGKKVATPDELRADAQTLKNTVKATPKQDVFLVLDQANANPKAVRKQVEKNFVDPFNKPTGGLMGRALSMIASVKLRADGIEVSSEQGKTIVRVPFQKSAIEQMGDLAVDMVEAVDKGLNAPRPSENPVTENTGDQKFSNETEASDIISFPRPRQSDHASLLAEIKFPDKPTD